MPTDSRYPLIDVPNVDLWTFLFERQDRPFPDDKGRVVWSTIEAEADDTCSDIC